MGSKEKGEDGTKPEVYQAVRVWLKNGTRVHGMWTGSKWWSVKGEIEPVKWELEERPKKTKKISKALPKFLKSPAKSA